MIGAMILKKMMGSGTDVMNERDVEKILKHWRDDAVMIYPGSISFSDSVSISGRTEGKENLRVFFRKFMEQFPKLTFTIKETYIKDIFAIGFSNTIASEFEVTYTNKHGETFENKGVTVIKILRGKVAQIEDYYFDSEKLTRAWRE
jgi:ketosteroid isomerase-like protein